MIRSGHVKFHDDLEGFMRPIEDVSPAPYNYNSGDIDAITTSIEQSGMYRPIYVQQSTGHIIAGNHTYMACKALGAEIIPTVVLDVSDPEAKKIMVEDNKIASLAQPDNGLLLALLDDIKDTSGLLGTGYTDTELEVLRHLNSIPLEPDDDFASWPTLSVQLPPHILRAYHHMTREADTDWRAFELLLKMAGWHD